MTGPVTPDVDRRLGAVLAGHAIGVTSPLSAFEVLQPSAEEALRPGLNKTRTVGLGYPNG